MNTKQDYINMKNTSQGKLALRHLLDYRYSWQNVFIYDSRQEGIEDSNHRMIENNGYFVQQEYKEDPNALIFKLGFTVAEVEELINN